MDLASIFLSIATLCLVAVTVSPLWRYMLLKYKLRHMKGPRGLPILGNILQLIGKDNVSFARKMDDWAEEFRDSGHFLIYFGTIPGLIVYNADDMETILRNTKIDRKGFFYRFVGDWLRTGLLLSDGPKWFSRRKLLSPSFHFSILPGFLGVINENAKYLCDKMCSLVNEPHVELHGMVLLCSLDTLAECMMGTKLGAQQGEDNAYRKAIFRIGEIFAQRFQYPWLWNKTIYAWSKPGKEQAKVLETLHKTTAKVIRDRKLELQSQSYCSIIDDKSQEARKRRKLVLLDLLIEVQRQDKTLTDEGIQEEVDTFLFEGHDTVATSMAFAFYLIGRHPEVQQKLQRELDDVFGNDRDRPVTMDDLQKLEYLGCVMKEGQRLFNTIPYVGRELTEDTRICGTVVPKGVTLFLGLYWLHRDPKHFPDPLKFDPDRFLPANSEGRHHFAFVPFSAGHRNCIGQKFAVMEQKTIMATVLRKIEITSLQTTFEELLLSYEMVLRPTSGIQVKLNLRK